MKRGSYLYWTCKTWFEGYKAVVNIIPDTAMRKDEPTSVSDEKPTLMEKLAAMPVKLGDIAHVFSGLQTPADDVFILEQVHQEGTYVECKSKATGHSHWFEEEPLKPYLKGSVNVRRYGLTDLTKRLIFPYETKDGKSVLIEAKDFKRRFPLTWAYLQKNQRVLSERNKGDMGQEWYGYASKKNYTRFGTPKLLASSVATGSCFTIDAEGVYYFAGAGGIGGGVYGIISLEGYPLVPSYLLGMLNSKLLRFYLKSISTPLFHPRPIALTRPSIEHLPIRTINFDSNDVFYHHRIVTLVTQMLELHQSLATMATAADREMFQRLIEATNDQIDALVYTLYGLTEEEIKMVESKRNDSI